MFKISGVELEREREKMMSVLERGECFRTSRGVSGGGERDIGRW
jgi:hypothetical protein